MSKSKLACFGGHKSIPEGMFVSAPLLDETDEHRAAQIVRDRRIEPIDGKHNLALRDEWASAVGAAQCLPVNSGMAALQTCLVAAGVKPGDEVIVPALTFTATASAVTRVGAIPIFADTTPDTFELDLRDADRKLSRRTRAIIPVHCHGLPCDMPALVEWARRAELAIVEDAAQAPGAIVDDVHVGAWGVATAWSHSRGKPVMAGGGGEVTTHSETVAHRAALFAGQGEERPRRLLAGEHRGYECVMVPCDNLRMTEHTAALVRGQLARLPSYLATARRNAEMLQTGMAAIDGLVPPFVPEGRTSSWTYFRFGLDLEALGWTGDPKHARDNVIRALFAEGMPVTTWLLRALDRAPGFRASSNGTLRPVDTEYCPATQRTLDCTAILGAWPYMLHVQPDSAVRHIVTAFEKVFEPHAIAAVLHDDHHPLAAVPPLSAD